MSKPNASHPYLRTFTLLNRVQWFSNLRMYLNHLKGLLKLKEVVSTPVWCSSSGWGLRFCLSNTQVMLSCWSGGDILRTTALKERLGLQARQQSCVETNSNRNTSQIRLCFKTQGFNLAVPWNLPRNSFYFSIKRNYFLPFIFLIWLSCDKNS